MKSSNKENNNTENAIIERMNEINYIDDLNNNTKLEQSSINLDSTKIENIKNKIFTNNNNNNTLITNLNNNHFSSNNNNINNSIITSKMKLKNKDYLKRIEELVSIEYYYFTIIGKKHFY